ncbi:hypothetical protein [Rhizobium ruizarguesonis]|uniref:Calx-beta domain-containing protein n=1 Tax=Rhizobium ruizarguesonis TaxID=2081791 RepID=A0AB38HVJ3_9HYPH|nr:hypothetical protein [Rhizobium ruizarguesonis]TAZ67040.1 hypothetical protein ELH68_34730 [Rhizobium ruizarguesonis]TAZ90112.1 hypothetical protein ELH64_35080 [Rhizobium ruizarguesonis]TBA10810.1 hypothetical protein ELH61_35120 [Rhizobium ruizarguesonis]TBB40711.1 hypothetical protein ELH44_35105 [Rhizobium ruizarguesonis]TBB59575.1 hypothetical protein ELH42_27240 [Rhizobium ruizarguesonis]
MLRISDMCLIAIAAGLLSSTPVLSQDAISAPAQKTIGAPKSKMVPSLAVLNSGGARLENGKLTMSGVSAVSIVFADRPVRSAGHVLTSEFIKQWGEGADSFAKDPPNATISVLSGKGDSVADAVVVLKTPKLEGANLTFDVAVLEGDLAGADGPASLFIDWFAARGPYGGVAVGGAGFRAPVWRGGWYAHPGAYYGAGVVAGAAIGAAVAEDRRYYPPPACGYYPYPPCY